MEFTKMAEGEMERRVVESKKRDSRHAANQTKQAAFAAGKRNEMRMTMTNNDSGGVTVNTDTKMAARGTWETHPAETCGSWVAAVVMTNRRMADAERDGWKTELQDETGR